MLTLIVDGWFAGRRPHAAAVTAIVSAARTTDQVRARAPTGAGIDQRRGVFAIMAAS